MRAWMLAAAAAAIAGGCSQETAAPVENEAESAALTPGLYELAWNAVEISATEGGEPATAAGEGAAGFAASTCVAADGAIDPAAFAEAGDTCTATSSYVRSGRISMQLECRREGVAGQVMQTVNGTSTADGFEAEVSTTTYLAGSGDYRMTRSVTARRAGECPAAGAEPSIDNAAQPQG